MRKTLSLFLVIILILGCLPVTGMAADGTEPFTHATVMVEDIYAVAGGTAKVKVLLVNNPGIAGAKITLSYDSALTLVDAVSGDALSDFVYTAPGSFSNPCNFTWDSESGDITGDGTMLTLFFRVAEDTPLNSLLNVDVSCRYGDIYNSNLDSVAFNTVGGQVTVLGYLPGDVNGDQAINGKDVTLVRRFNAGGYDVSIHEAAADVNADGLINGKDITLLRRYVAGGYDVVLLPAPERCLHAMTMVDRQTATCTQNGVIAHWRCQLCGRLFADQEGTVHLTQKDITLIALGHTPVVDPAVAPSYSQTGLTEGSHCAACGEVIVAQQVVPALKATYHSIIYHNLNGAESPTVTQYAEHEGLDQLPQLSLPGYDFLGWYTEQEGGQKIADIPAGSTRNVELYARWRIIEYSITYDCRAYERGKGTNAPENKLTYTVKDTVFLYDASLQGYFFDGWVDEDGAPISVIQKGSTGDRVLTATWRSTRNLAHPAATITNPLYEAESFLQEYKKLDDGSIEYLDQYSFVYYLGYIERVPIGEAKDLILHDNTRDYTDTYSTRELTASETTKVTDLITSNTRGWQSSVSVSLEVGVEVGFVSTSVGTEITDTQSGETTTTSETHDTVTYSNERIEAQSKAAEIKMNQSPQGWYRLINFATVDVFAVVTYDVTENKVHYTNVNRVRDVMADWDYSAKSQAFDDEVDVDLPFQLPSEKINDFIRSLRTKTDGLKIKQSGNTCTVERYFGKETDIVIPSYIDVLDDTNGDGIDETVSLRVVGISADAFSGNTEITSVSLGRHITEIPDDAFNGCTALETVTYDGELQRIGQRAFSGCSNFIMPLPDTLEVLGDHAFDGCVKFDSLTVPDELTLGTQAFANCGELQLSANPKKTQQLKPLLNSGATTLNLNLAALSEKKEFIEVGSLNLPAGVESFTVIGIRGKRYDLAVSAATQQTTLKNVAMTGSCSIDTGKLTLMEAAIEGTLQMNGDLLLLQGTVALGPVCTDSAALTLSPTADNMAELKCTGGIQAAGNLTLTGIMDAHIIGSASASGIEAEGLNIDVMGDVNIQGHPGAAEHNGGVAVSVNTVTVTMDGDLTIQGGDGGNGINGPGYFGYHGEFGTDAGNGGNALDCQTFTVMKAGSITITGGKGGNGGRGYNGHQGRINLEDSNYHHGGDGGFGGNGGDGGHAFTGDVYILDAQSISIVGGDGGNGGHAGRGGDGGDPGGTYYVKKPAGFNGGDGGMGGGGGNGGNGLTPGKGGAPGLKGGRGYGTYGVFGLFGGYSVRGENGYAGDDGNPGMDGKLSVISQQLPTEPEVDV